jgi:hypothetical protein
VESRRQHPGHNRNRSLKKKLVARNPTATGLSLPNIEELIAYGDITVGVLRPIGCLATAADPDRCLAMLIRRRGETLGQLLTRLDQAIDKAINEDIFTDEINPPPNTHP